MTKEQLAKLKAALEVPFEKMPIIPEPANLWRHEAKALVAEVERLRTSRSIHRNALQKCADDTDRLEAEAERAEEYTSQLIEEHRAVMEQNDALLAEHAAMREIVQVVAAYKPMDVQVYEYTVASICPFCESPIEPVPTEGPWASFTFTGTDTHTPECPITKARARLAENENERAKTDSK